MLMQLGPCFYQFTLSARKAPDEQFDWVQPESRLIVAVISVKVRHVMRAYF